MSIHWGVPLRPKKADQGHSPAQYGSLDRYGRYHTYVLCQCGTRLSGRGSDGGIDSYRKHRKRKLDKLEELEQA